MELVGLTIFSSIIFLSSWQSLLSSCRVAVHFLLNLPPFCQIFCFSALLGLTSSYSNTCYFSHPFSPCCMFCCNATHTLQEPQLCYSHLSFSFVLAGHQASRGVLSPRRSNYGTGERGRSTLFCLSWCAGTIPYRMVTQFQHLVIHSFSLLLLFRWFLNTLV